MKKILKIRPVYSNSHAVSIDPLIVSIDNVVTPAECKAIIEAATPSIERAKVSTDGEGIISKGRTGGNAWVDHGFNQTTLAVCQRIANIVDIPLFHAESMQVIHYGEQQEYKPHFDAYDLSTPRGQRCCRRGGQRMVTALVYLNEIDEGGATIFPIADAQIEAQRGRLAVFHNCTPDTTDVHPKSLHAGAPVIKGEKWAFNLWFRNRPTSEIIKY